MCPAGPTGPCGPCSEIYEDIRHVENCPDPDNCTPACDCGRFVEIWNIVFTSMRMKKEIYLLTKKEY